MQRERSVRLTLMLNTQPERPTIIGKRGRTRRRWQRRGIRLIKFGRIFRRTIPMTFAKETNAMLNISLRPTIFVLIASWSLVIAVCAFSFGRPAIIQLSGVSLILTGIIFSRILYCTEQRDSLRLGSSPLIRLSDLSLLDKIRRTVDSQLTCVGLLLLITGWLLDTK